jgi:hypothetical protein
MSWGYPDGVSQSTHDRAFGESLSSEPDDDIVRLDCGHYDTELRGEEVGGKLVCPKCYDERLKTVTELLTGHRCGCGPDYLDPDCAMHCAAAAKRALKP